MPIKFLSIISAAIMFFCCPKVANAAYVIKIANQQEFDNLPGTINDCILHGEQKLKIVFSPGAYFYNENHLCFDGTLFQKTNLSVTIVGNGANLIACGKTIDLSKSDVAISPNNVYFSSDYRAIEIWSQLYESDGLIEVVSESNKQCRIKNNSGIQKETSTDSYIQITSWYTSYIYKVDRIDDEYIYFTVDNLKMGYKNGWNVNNDFNYGQSYPRYRLCNVKELNTIVKETVSYQPTFNTVYETETTRFLYIGKQTNIKRLVIDGISFYGGASDGLDGILVFNSINSQCVVQNCTFKHICSYRVISVNNSNSVSVRNCLFSDCSESCIFADNSSSNTTITNNVFSNCGTNIKNSSCVRCEGTSFYIANNTFEDYGYSAIWVGKRKRENEISGIVECNKLQYSVKYIREKRKKTLMDSGAIYVSTQNDNVIIRYNYICNYSGILDNRGIFCDDGARNITIYGNIIYGIDNGFCIDSRQVEDADKSVRLNNTNNVIEENYLQGSIRFEGSADDNNGCKYGRNYYLVNDSGPLPQNKVVNVKVIGEEMVIRCDGINNSKIEIPVADYRTMKKSQAWRRVRKYITKKRNS